MVNSLLQINSEKLQRVDYQYLIDQAEEAKKFSYSPYSSFKVGAALLTDANEIFLGTNVENAAYGSTICAERTAYLKAISEGYTNFVAIAVTTDVNEAYPCGQCKH
jgi:cytidine deaminase